MNLGAEIGLSFKLNIGSTDSFRLGLNLKVVGMNPLNVMVKKPTCDFGQNKKNWNVGWSKNYMKRKKMHHARDWI